MVLFLLGRAIIVRTFLTVIMGAMLLGSCAANAIVGSTQAVSAQKDKDSAAIISDGSMCETAGHHEWPRKGFVQAFLEPKKPDNAPGTNSADTTSDAIADASADTPRKQTLLRLIGMSALCQ